MQKYKSLTKLIEIALKSRCGLTHIAGWSGMKKRGQKEQPFGKFLLPLGKTNHIKCRKTIACHYATPGKCSISNLLIHFSF